jgi:hypothetical protein
LAKSEHADWTLLLLYDETGQEAKAVHQVQEYLKRFPPWAPDAPG